MKQIFDLFFSMVVTVLLLVIFATSVGYATFIENSDGTQVAFTRVYNALWFEFLMFLLAVNLLGSLAKHQLFKKPKCSIALFHLAFLLILLGAALTRYTGFEGIIHIREGETVFSIPSESVQMNGTADHDVANAAIAHDAFTHKLPFGIKLHDFKIERYPGSNSPSSFASEITVIDTLTKAEKPYRIFMNNVLKYRGYRVFQSSYDLDERGTILSVSNDFWGTSITYLGYFLLMFGMVVTLFNKNSRFRELLRLSAKLQSNRTHKKTALLLLAFCTTASVLSVDKQTHINSLDQLLVQDIVQGRIEPFNTFTTDVFRKIYKKTNYKGLSSTEVVLGMISNPETWQNEALIKVANRQLANELGATHTYVSFSQLFDYTNGGKYLLTEKVEAAYKKSQSARTKYEKELMYVDERANICYRIFTGDLLHLFPNKGDIHAPWLSAPMEAHHHRTLINENIPPTSETAILYANYLQSVRTASVTGNWQLAETSLQAIKDFQMQHGKSIIPNSTKIKIEIAYNRLNPFYYLAYFYLIVGLFVLFLHFILVFKPTLRIETFLFRTQSVFWFAFVMYTLAMSMRWYISNHAPWSNAYEAMLFIGWAAALSGLVFSRRSPMTLAVTAVLAAIALAVAGMSWMNPEITNLVPVLKSNWLIGHVAIITSSYGFLAMSALLGFINLVLMIARNPRNDLHLSKTIQELAYTIELGIYIGLVLLTSGCFLGAVWANESWGRYWGWDPKEAWALVSILVYASILHMRSIPKLNNRFALSAAAMLGFSSIIMTFFGVNYYLSGLHSYAQGPPPPLPAALYFVLPALAVVIGWAYHAEQKK